MCPFLAPLHSPSFQALTSKGSTTHFVVYKSDRFTKNDKVLCVIRLFNLETNFGIQNIVIEKVYVLQLFVGVVSGKHFIFTFLKIHSLLLAFWNTYDNFWKCHLCYPG